MATARITIKGTEDPKTDFYLDCDRIGQNLQENYTLLRFYLRAVSRSSSLGEYSKTGSQLASIDDPNGIGTLWKQEYTGNKDKSTYGAGRFIAGNTVSGYDRWNEGPYDVKIYHGADGRHAAITLRMSIDYNVGASNQFSKTASATFNDFPFIPLYPGAPIPYSIDSITQNYLVYRFNSNGDGGAPILEWQVGYGTDPNNPQYFTGSNGVTEIGGLSRNTTYYFWSRGRNIKGWGAWSARWQANTLAYVPAPPTPTYLGDATQTTVHYTFRGEDDGGAPVLEWQVGWSLDPNNIQFLYGSNGDIVINNLSPGATWYFWARGRNQSGWSDWSARSQIRTIAGARIKVDGAWKEAIPYVNVNGVWRLAQPYAKSVGLWKRAI